ncbi:MAG: tetratricopeptide repeat protein [Promethearchaeota archaeon]
MTRQERTTNIEPTMGSAVPTRTTAYEDDLRRRLSAFPRDSQSWYNLGRYLHSIGRLEEAEKALRKAISLNPQPPHFWRELESILTSLGRPTKARPGDSIRDRIANLRMMEKRVEVTNDDMSPCISCKEYTYYGCSRGKACDLLLRWRRRVV